jgi:hypothetical protein
MTCTCCRSETAPFYVLDPTPDGYAPVCMACHEDEDEGREGVRSLAEVVRADRWEER